MHARNRLAGTVRFGAGFSPRKWRRSLLPVIFCKLPGPAVIVQGFVHSCNVSRCVSYISPSSHTQSFQPAYRMRWWDGGTPGGFNAALQPMVMAR